MNTKLERIPNNLKITCRRHLRRRGSAYMLVLGTSLVLMATGLAAIMAVRVERRNMTSATDFHAARLYAQSAIEVGFQLMRDDPSWRTNYTSGPWITDAVIGQGTYSLTVTDPDDADLLNTPNDFVLMSGSAKKGNASFTLQVTLQPNGTGYEVVPESWVHSVN